mmetsp:Transcript_16773/g.31781  ORF Transcript_16773/g.31781 Transcript_16773/m.31781 type:complete len:94 (+) Transcript_16773:78-359(+)
MCNTHTTMQSLESACLRNRRLGGHPKNGLNLDCAALQRKSMKREQTPALRSSRDHHELQHIFDTCEQRTGRLAALSTRHMPRTHFNHRRGGYS